MNARPPRPKDARAAFDAAAKMLARGPLGGEGLVERLVRRGFEESVAREGVARLEELGLLRERASAEAIVHATRRDLPAGEALLRANLEKRGVEATAAEDAVREATHGADEACAARDLARAAVARMRATLDAKARARRALGLLARRGFDEETSFDAVRAAIPEAFEDG